MTTSWLIVSYARDSDWIPYLLKSLARYSSGFHEIVIAVPEPDLPAFQRFGLTKERLVTFSEAGFACGFMAHQYYKCCADQFCHSEIIAHIDSDCVLTSPVTPETFIQEGKPVNLCTRFDSLNKDKVQSPWQPGTERILGRKVEYETMRRHPNLYPWTLYSGLRKHVAKVRLQTMEELVKPMARNANFSEFCVLGAYGMYFMPDAINWRDTDIEGTPPNPVHQFWSHNRPTHPEVQSKLGELGLL